MCVFIHSVPSSFTDKILCSSSLNFTQSFLSIFFASYYIICEIKGTKMFQLVEMVEVVEVVEVEAEAEAEVEAAVAGGVLKGPSQVISSDLII